MTDLRPLSAPARGAGASICPHCWMVNPGPFRLCARCGASMDTLLQESAGLRRTAPIQSPVPVHARLSLLQRAFVGTLLAVFALTYLVHLVPPDARLRGQTPAPASSGGR